MYEVSECAGGWAAKDKLRPLSAPVVFPAREQAQAWCDRINALEPSPGICPNLIHGLPEGTGDE